jgi:hypothetical protein
MDYGCRRGVQIASEQWQLDHRRVGLRDRDKPRLDVEVGQRYLVGRPRTGRPQDRGRRLADHLAIVDDLFIPLVAINRPR